jgi:CBS domain-containing protein
MSEVADFLRAHAPFDALDEAELERVAATTELEPHAAGATIFAQGADPVRHLRVVRSGAVELILDGRVLDRLEPGELLGHPSMLSGLATGFAARAAQDTVCLRIPDDVAQQLLARPAGLRYIARSLLAGPRAGDRGTPHAALDAGRRPVGQLVRGAPVVCTPDTPIREAAQRMTELRQTAVVVALGDGAHGIVTDRDLRTRVVATGVEGDTPLSAVMTAPAYTAPPDRLASDVLLDMLDRDLRHYPVISATGEVLGVVDDMDLVAVETRSSFHLRQAIARATTPDDVIAAAKGLPQLAITLHDARVAAADIAAIETVVIDALTRRLLELAVAARPEPLPSFSWLALGSQARREVAPSSDVDSAIVWFDSDAPDDVAHAALHPIGAEVSATLEACGLRADEHRATAADPLFVRSRESWQRAARSWLADPTQEQAALLVSVCVDSRPVWGVHLGSPLADTFRGAADNAALLRLIANMALARRPPTGFLRGLVVEDSGEHRGRLDLKSGGLVPIVNLARWAGMAAGVTSASTRERLKAAGEVGTLPAGDAQLLREAFDLMGELRLAHQVDQLRAGVVPDDHVDPETLSPLMRAQLKEAFRAVASVQKRV